MLLHAAPLGTPEEVTQTVAQSVKGCRELLRQGKSLAVSPGLTQP